MIKYQGISEIKKLHEIVKTIDRKKFKNIKHAKIRYLLAELLEKVGSPCKNFYKITEFSGKYSVYMNHILVDKFETEEAAKMMVRQLKKKEAEHD